MFAWGDPDVHQTFQKDFDPDPNGQAGQVRPDTPVETCPKRQMLVSPDLPIELESIRIWELTSVSIGSRDADHHLLPRLNFHAADGGRLQRRSDCGRRGPQAEAL